ncbi:MAG TPA: hypothetical protein VK610_07295 [Rhodothermales bacterium]|nr:hypothetical protein [Rhodothermales bacterium]
MRPLPPRLAVPLGVLLLLSASGCASSNRLGEVDLTGRRVAVLAAIPPHPRVQAGDQGEAAVNLYDPVGTAIRVGTAAAKYREIRAAQARLDSAVVRVDVADRIARRVLAGSAAVVGFEPVSNPAQADYHLDLQIYDYALVADSYEGATFFALEGLVRLVDPRTGRELWHRRLREREVIDGSVFRMPAALGNVVTARALAALSEEEMARGLVQMADMAADRIVQRLREDYLSTRPRR